MTQKMNRKLKIHEKEIKNNQRLKINQKTYSNKIKIITLLQQCKLNEKYSKINMNSYNFYKWKYQS